MERSNARRAELRAAVAADRHRTHRVAHTATTKLIDRAADTGRFALEWDRFAEVAAPSIGEDAGAMTVGVMANMISVVSLAEAEDFSTLNDLVRQYGHEAVAAVQTAVDDLLGLGDSMPLATRCALKLPGSQRIVDSLVAAGAEHGAARAIARRCSRSAYWLVMADKHYRDLADRHDRQLVAREIRRLVAMSGLSQRQFAALCGTSAPRISTYVNGLVTPSAAMMVRFVRVSQLAQRQGRSARGSPA